jgi:hypothetical protein
MKKAIITILALAFTISCLSACGKEKDEIVRIEASNAAGNATGEERKYEDTNKEPVVRPDQREKETTSSEEEQQQEVDTSEIDTSIYGNWIDGAGTSFTIYEEDDVVKFSGHEAETDRRLYGTVQTDDETYIEFIQKRQKSDEELALEEQASQIIEVPDDLPEGAEKEGQNTEINVLESYGSEEEYNKAMEEEQKAMEEGTLNKDEYETIRYEITEKKVSLDENRVYMTISNENKTYSLYRYIE